MAGNAGRHHRARCVAVRQGQVQPGEQRLRRPAGADPARIQQHQVVRQAGDLVHGVADVQHGNIEFALQVFQVGQDVSLALRVQCGQGFVHQQQARATGQGARHRHTLAFAARERVRLALEQRGDAQQGDGLLQRDAALGRGYALLAKGQVLRHAQVRKQPRVLKHIAQRALVYRHEEALAVVLPDLAVDHHAPGGAPLQPGNGAQATGFA